MAAQRHHEEPASGYVGNPGNAVNVESHAVGEYTDWGWVVGEKRTKLDATRQQRSGTVRQTGLEVPDVILKQGISASHIQTEAILASLQSGQP